MPTLVVILAVLGLAILVGVILLMMIVRTGIQHSPEQGRLGVEVDVTSKTTDSSLVTPLQWLVIIRS